MPAPQTVLDLAARFEKNLDSYLSQGYNETQLRKEFINPFFEALGWDVRNTSGKAEAYKDVIHEDAIKIGKTTKAPDYSFRIGGSKKFFLEAKKPAVNIKDNADAAYQIRRYSWSGKLPLAILTNFDALAVYDCRQKPKPTDKADVGRIHYIPRQEYASKWDVIAGIFSKSSIETGLFDQYAESVKGKKGTTEVDDEFLREIEGWRDLLARNIALRNPKLSLPEMNFAVQTTIDRIVFLRICEDRGIEPYGQLQSLHDKENIYRELKKIYEVADEKYNSGLFHFREEKGRSSHHDGLSMSLDIDDKVLKDIIKRLYYPESPYVFSVLSVDILGNVYEQFLGKVIRLTESHHAKVEEKPEVKKAGGVYYTPKYIVDYIVENTVGKLILDKTPKDITELKVLDPACGSGSFLIGAYTYLLKFHRDWYVDHKPEKHTDEIYQGRGGQWYLTTQEKKRILLNNIYGVDIDGQAVEVTKLNLMLKVLENESQDTLQAQKKLFRERALPDLDNNIKCGNSLIGPEFYQKPQTTLLGQEEQHRINVFDWEKEYPIKFDAVIGNPPYIRIQAMKEWAPVEVEFYKEKYKSATKGNYDIYVVFVEKGLSLIKDGGLLGFILPHKFFQSKYGEPLRKIIADGRHLEEVVHFGDQQVFEKATTYTSLMFLGKNTGTRKLRFIKAHDLAKWRTTKKAEEGKISLNDINEKEWNFTVGKGAELFDKLNKLQVRLDGLVEKIYQGLATSADSIYVLGVETEGPKISTVKSMALNGEVVKIESSLLHPLLKGSEISRYDDSKYQYVVLFPYKIDAGSAIPLTEDELKLGYPAAYEYLTRNKALLMDRSKVDPRMWWIYPYPKNLSMYCRPKILSQVLSTRGNFTLDLDGKFYFLGGGTAGGNAIKVRNDTEMELKYLLGILNSKITTYYVSKVASGFRGGYFAFGKGSLANLPLPDTKQDESNSRSLIVSLVSQLLDLHKRLGAARTPDEKTLVQRQIDAADAEIDRIVYQLYGLSEDEIKIVEGEDD
jgi:type I restriction-modification system DNA methylase subunit